MHAGTGRFIAWTTQQRREFAGAVLVTLPAPTSANTALATIVANAVWHALQAGQACLGEVADTLRIINARAASAEDQINMEATGDAVLCCSLNS
jgi:hypothetical protein